MRNSAPSPAGNVTVSRPFRPDVSTSRPTVCGTVARGRYPGVDAPVPDRPTPIGGSAMCRTTRT
jgi:hypothetical protein